MNQQNNSYNSYFPWDDINEDEEWGAGTYHVKVIHAEDGYSQSSNKRMFRVGFSCVEPKECANMSHFENYVVGSDEAPAEIVSGTMGARGFKKLLKAGQVPPNNDINALFASLRGAELMVAMSYKPEADFKNNVTNYFRLGERSVQVQPIQKSGVVGGVAQAPVAPAAPQPAVPQAPPVAAPTPAQPVQPVQPAPAAPQAPPAAPTQPAPPQAPAPVAPTVPQAPTLAGNGAPGAGPDATPMHHCGICGYDFTPQDFGNHVQWHASNPGAQYQPA